MKLANRRAGYLSSLSLIRAGGAQRVILLCEAAGYRRHERRGEAWRTTKRNTAAGGGSTCGCRCSPKRKTRYLRDVGQGYQIKGVMDYQHVRELVRVNGDLGRLGGLLKLWLTDDVRTLQFGEATILALLGRIEATQDEMSRIMKAVVQPRAEP